MQGTIVISIDKIDELNSEAWSINRKEPKKAITACLDIIKQSEAQNYLRGKALALRTLGACYIWVSRNEEALEKSFEAIQILKQLGDKFSETECLYSIGTNFFYLSDYNNALKYFSEAFNLAEEIQNASRMADGLNGMGTVYYTIGKNEEAKNCLHRSLEICEQIKDYSTMVKVLDGLGESYLNLKDYEKANLFFSKCIDVSEKYFTNPQAVAFSYGGLGRSYAEQNLFENSLKNFRLSQEGWAKISFKAGEANTLTRIGELYERQEDFTQALENLLLAHAIASEINSKEWLFKSSEVIARIYEKQNNSAKALHYYKIFHRSEEEARSEKTHQMVRSLDLQHRIQKEQQEKEMLQQKNQQLETLSENLVLLGNIGKKITSLLSVESIVETVYSSVNNLMDATGFGIGLYDVEKHAVVYPIYIEGKEKYKSVVYSLKDTERLTAKCFITREEIVINDYDRDIDKYIQVKKAPIAGKRCESIIYLPLELKGKILGVITVQSFDKERYSPYEVNILRNLATYASIGLENAKLYNSLEETVRERTQELVVKKEEVEKAYENNRLLSEIGQQITSSLSFEEIYQKLYHCVSQQMDAGCFGIRMYKPEKSIVEYRFEIEQGVRDEGVHEVSMDDVDNYSVWCIHNRKAIFINDNLTEYKKYVNRIRVVTGDMPHSLIFYPVMIGEKILGCITIQSFNRNAYREYHLDILKTLASYTAIALENANLYENMEDLVKLRTAEVVKQKAIIEEKNKDITDSIKYAKKIQQAIMPREEEIQNVFPESFVFYKPKDIVSGDFYWFENMNADIAVFAVADCTGHGVPGAFMSAICNDLMNQVIRDGQETNPGLALQMLDKKLNALLYKSSDHGAADGMDIALCTLDKKKNILYYSGAHRPMIIIRNQQVMEFKPTKHSIGGYLSGEKEFETHTIQLQPEDLIYIFTDGYTDQFGGPGGKKFKYKQLQKLLLEIADMNMISQKSAIEESMSKWRGEHEQIDDNLIFGLRLSRN